MPALHYSSFEAGDGLKIPMPDPDADDRALYGFIQQAEQVAVGANAIIERAVHGGAVDRASRACTWCPGWWRRSATRRRSSCR